VHTSTIAAHVLTIVRSRVMEIGNRGQQQTWLARQSVGETTKKGPGGMPSVAIGAGIHNRRENAKRMLISLYRLCCPQINSTAVFLITRHQNLEDEFASVPEHPFSGDDDDEDDEEESLPPHHSSASSPASVHSTGQSRPPS
jgi:hypothetical protein